ncbi:DNA-protecting protein DprA [Pseudomonas sp. MSSRFD41]|uniref:DNA-processing protein DprA n=1 Tax=unclassified Pseudomonas TaxID=196821 RepID=UPI00163A0968|nr:DNA-processing protein DprA [Pseudomonas sp. MSSRFD41]MBC2653910.1 DNA-protecting protein DprA [Pseudomonas sp. MSSRFD41]
MSHSTIGAISPAELEARLRLHGLPGLGPMRFKRLLQAFGGAAKALSAPAAAWQSLGLPAACAEARRSATVREDARRALAWIDGQARHLLMWDQPGYPALLAQLEDAPPLLFVAGDPTILESPQLALVGSRRASRPGLDTAAAFSRNLAAAGFVITSGLALGIDGAAHRAALEVGGRTVAVLGTGLENCYPQHHRELARAMVEQGSALVSEFALDTGPRPEHFPRRNRIISGLSLGVLVVEASVASGSLITARLAAEQGREVYAIPGSIHHPGARGCHQLIRDGAVLVESVQHILETLQGWQRLPPPAEPVATDSHPLLALLQAAPQGSEALALASGWPLPRVLASLTELEVDGRVVNENGRWFARLS